MRSWLVLCALYLPLTVFSTNVADDSYDDYYDEEETTSANQPTWKPSKEVPKLEAYADIFKFYDTREKIWVYNSTKKSEETCQVDDIDHTTYINVFMTRYFFLNGTINTLTINSDFGVHPTIQHTTHTYNEIQIRIPGPHDWFELRLWNSSLENGPDKNCSHGFEEITASFRKTFNYTSVCQCILRVQP
uniref:Lipocalin n=1 Tax=Rhipicephalus zambeziensis TaxID=60191 RepID=A0A224YC82_9ACAR